MKNCDIKAVTKRYIELKFPNTNLPLLEEYVFALVSQKGAEAKSTSLS